METSCRFCNEHNLYGQKAASQEVKIDDLKEAVGELKRKISDLYRRLDQFCTKKAFVVLLSCLLSIFGGSMFLQFSMNRDIGVLSTKVETIQKMLEGVQGK